MWGEAPPNTHLLCMLSDELCLCIRYGQNCTVKSSCMWCCCGLVGCCIDAKWGMNASHYYSYPGVHVVCSIMLIINSVCMIDDVHAS
jgi:hypothetical protein